MILVRDTQNTLPRPGVPHPGGRRRKRSGPPHLPALQTSLSQADTVFASTSRWETFPPCQTTLCSGTQRDPALSIYVRTRTCRVMYTSLLLSLMSPYLVEITSARCTSTAAEKDANLSGPSLSSDPGKRIEENWTAASLVVVRTQKALHQEEWRYRSVEEAP